MKGLLFSFAVVILLVLVVACESSVSISLYVRDMLDVSDGESLIAYSVLSIKKERDLDDELIDVIRVGFPEASGFRVEGDYILADIEIPLVSSRNEIRVYPESMFVVICEPLANDEVLLALSFSEALFTRLSETIYDEYYQRLDTDDMDIFIRIHNDMRDTVSFELTSVYANRDPIPFTETLTLGSRQNLDLRFSDVLRDYTFENQFAPVGKMF